MAARALPGVDRLALSSEGALDRSSRDKMRCRKPGNTEERDGEPGGDLPPCAVLAQMLLVFGATFIFFAGETSIVRLALPELPRLQRNLNKQGCSVIL